MDISTYSREQLVDLCKVADQAERYDEVVKWMNIVVTKNADLSSEERTLLSVAYKNIVAIRRTAHKAISSVLAKSDNEMKKNEANAYLERIEDDLKDRCDKALDLVTEHLIPNAKNDETKVFYLKMVGDYRRYLAEAYGMKPAKREEAMQASEKAYLDATELAKNLPPTNSIRLGLALNFSVFYYEIKNAPSDAISLAKSAFENAVEHVEGMPQDELKESLLIVQLLRDNLTLWTSEADNDDEDDGGNAD